jgi:hypothetical protein
VSQSPVTSTVAGSKTFWSRVWAFAKLGGPALVATAALVISLLTYQDQHAANEAASAADQRQQAEQVSFWIQAKPGKYPEAVLMVQNRSVFPINGAVIDTAIESIDSTSTHWVHLLLVYIPPCSIGTTNAVVTLKKIAHAQFFKVKSNSESNVETISMSFIDHSGVAWTYWISGALRRAVPATLRHDPGPMHLVTAKFTDANSCTP